MKSNAEWLCGVDLLNIHIRYTTQKTYIINELLLTVFSPFDTKSEKLNVRNVLKYIFRASRNIA